MIYKLFYILLLDPDYTGIYNFISIAPGVFLSGLGLLFTYKYLNRNSRVYFGLFLLTLIPALLYFSFFEKEDDFIYSNVIASTVVPLGIMLVMNVHHALTKKQG
jgi:hypothetical protein